MTHEQREGWTEEDRRDAARLLAGMRIRRKNRAGGYPAQIGETTGPTAAERVGRESGRGAVLYLVRTLPAAVG